MQFYVGDYMKDPGVRALSHHDKGVWVDILCLMHESERRGLLLLNGKPMTEAALAQALGLSLYNMNAVMFAGVPEDLLNQIPTTDLTSTLTRILDFGVASRDEETGALMCRRMVRDEALRQIRTECGRLGGNPKLVGSLDNQNSTNRDKQKRTTRHNQKSTPSSSSSSSKEEESEESGDRFSPNGEKDSTEKQAAAKAIKDPLSGDGNKVARGLAKLCYGAVTPESRARFTKEQVLAIKAEAKRLRETCDVEKLADWKIWFDASWLGKKLAAEGGYPKLSHIRETWSKAFPDADPDEPASTDDQGVVGDLY
jgi:hypothetical protein